MNETPTAPEPGRDDKDAIDAEFSKLMEGLGFDDSLLEDVDPRAGSGESADAAPSAPAPSGPNAPGGAGALTGPTPAHPGDVQVPDDLSSLGLSPAAEDPNAPRPLAIVATPLASAKALAGVIRLALAAEDDLPTLPDGTVTLDAVSGAIAAGPLSEAEAHTLAHLTSLGLQRQGVVLFWRQGDRMIAARYRYGRNEGETPPALVLGALSGEVEDLLLGIDRLEDAEDTYDPASLSRTEAMAWIARGRKRKK